MDPSATTIHKIVPSNFTPECDRAPFEQLPHDLMKTIFALLSHTSKHMMHSVSSRFTLILHDDRYFTEYFLKKLTKKPNEKQLNFIIKQKAEYIENLRAFKLVKMSSRITKGSQIRLMFTTCRNLTSLDLSEPFYKSGILLEETGSGRLFDELTCLKTLYSLNLRRSGIIADDLKYIGNLTTLKILNLSLNELNMGDGLNNLTKLQLLENLNLNGSGVTDPQLDHIISLTNLKVLNLQDCKVTDEGLKKLTFLKQLEVLDLSLKNCKSILTSLADLKLKSLVLNLKTLVFQSDLFFNFDGLELNTSLTSLIIRITTFTPVMSPVALDRISMLPQLKVLNLQGNRIDGEGLKNLSKLQKLEYLDLYFSLDTRYLKPNPKIISVFNEVFPYLINLYYLNLGGSYCTDAAMKTIGRLTALQKLFLDECMLSSMGIESITNLTNLFNLSLIKNEITDDGALKLTHLTNLRILAISHNEICNNSVIPIISCLIKLKKLVLDNTRISESIIDPLLKLPFLNELLINDVFLNPEEIINKLSVKDFKRLEVTGMES